MNSLGNSMLLGGPLYLGFDQVESQSRALANRSSNTLSKNDDSLFLLAQSGLNPQKVQQEIQALDPNAIFYQQAAPVSQTDLNTTLQHIHETTILETIARTHKKMHSEFYKNISSRLTSDWLSLRDDSYSTTVPQSSKLNSKYMRFQGVVDNFNAARLTASQTALLFDLAQLDPQEEMSSSYRLLAKIVREAPGQESQTSQRHYAQAYYSSGEPKNQITRQLVTQSKGWLEEQFVKYMDRILQNNASQVGGIPSIENKIRAFVNMKYPSSSNQYLERIGNVAIWPILFYLIRAGHAEVAVNVANQASADLAKLDKDFLGYLTAWWRDLDHRLQPRHRETLVAEYNLHLRPLAGGVAVNQSFNSSNIDPYKHALYKLIGRVEISKRNVPLVTQTMEDWVWFQLWMVREESSPASGPGNSLGLDSLDSSTRLGTFSSSSRDRYTLSDLGAVLRKFGSAHFTQNGKKPLVWFNVLLLSGQFERAVAFLLNEAEYYVDAVHAAIALVYYGLLRVPPKSIKAGVDFLLPVPTASDPDAISVDFATLIHRYTKKLPNQDPEASLQYYYLISLSSDAPAPIGHDQVEIGLEYVRELVVSSKRVGAMLGDLTIEGGRIPGTVERNHRLLGLSDPTKYLSEVVASAARTSQREDRFKDAILLYSLAKKYSSALRVLCDQLGKRLMSTPEPEELSTGSPTVAKSLSIILSNPSLVYIAKEIITFFKQSPEIQLQISPDLFATAERLLLSKGAVELWQQDRWAEALDMLDKTSILPLTHNIYQIMKITEGVKDLDEAISRNMDDLLLVAMGCIWKLWEVLKNGGSSKGSAEAVSAFGEEVGRMGEETRLQKMNELKQKARALMTFAGSLRYQLSRETFASLSRYDVFIS